MSRDEAHPRTAQSPLDRDRCPRLKRPDGIDIYWEEQREGPLVVLAPFFNYHPSAFADLIADLTRDHRVARFDARGTGESTRVGPHDIETNSADLAAVIREPAHPRSSSRWETGSTASSGSLPNAPTSSAHYSG